MRWTAAGWFRMTSGDRSKPLPKPNGGQGSSHGQPLSDDFAEPLKLGAKWNFFRPGSSERDRIGIDKGALVLKVAGTAPVDSSTLLLIAGDQRMNPSANSRSLRRYRGPRPALRRQALLWIRVRRKRFVTH